MDFREKAILYRVIQNYSTIKMSKEIGIGQPAYSKFEKGLKASPLILGKIMAFLFKQESKMNIEYSFLFEKVQVKMIKNKVSITKLSKELNISEFRFQTFFKGKELREDEIIKIENWYNE